MNDTSAPVQGSRKSGTRPVAAASALEFTGARRGAITPPVLALRLDPAPCAAGDVPFAFWEVKKRDLERHPKAALQSLLYRVRECPPVRLFDVVERGVPTDVVLLLAGAFGNSAAWAMNLIGVSETTFRRKEEANEPLPEVAGHRVMGFLRIVATLQRLLDESGDAALVAAFDLEGWVSDWIRNPLPELGGKTPAEMLRNPEGQRAVVELLERMRGGLPA